MDIGLILGAVAIGAAIVVPFAIEALKRPRLEIVPAQWSPTRPAEWTFAIVHVRNKPLAAPLTRLLTRQVAQACVVEIDYSRWETPDVKMFPPVPGRWSSHPEPIRSVPGAPEFAGPPITGGRASNIAYATSGFSISGFSTLYDPTIDPPQHDIAVSQAGKEVAVAVLRDGKAFAFSTASYNYPAWGNPDWYLDRATYRIVVRVRGSSVQQERAFKLEYLSDDFASFRLQVA